MISTEQIKELQLYLVRLVDELEVLIDSDGGGQTETTVSKSTVTNVTPGSSVADSSFSKHIKDKTIHVTEENKLAWDSKADGDELSGHINDGNVHVTEEEKLSWNGKVDDGSFATHTDDADIHVTKEEKESWDSKVDSDELSDHANDTDIHVTKAEKDSWNKELDLSEYATIQYVDGLVGDIASVLDYVNRVVV